MSARLSDVEHRRACRFPDDICECLMSLFEHQTILAARLAEAEQAAEQRERERWVTAVEALADEWSRYRTDYHRGHASLLRALVAQQRDGGGSE